MADAGWYPDPTSRHQYRYFDGDGWSGHVADNTVQSWDDLTSGWSPGWTSSTVQSHPQAAGLSENLGQPPMAKAQATGPSENVGQPPMAEAQAATWGNLSSRPQHQYTAPPGAPMGRIARSMRLLRVSLHLADGQPGLFLVPIVSGLIQAAMLAVALWIAWATRTHTVDFNGASRVGIAPIGYVVLAFAGLLSTYVNAVGRGVIADRIYATLHASHRTNSEAFADCMARSHKLFGWAVYRTAVQLLLNFLRRFGLAGAILDRIGQVAWSLVTMFVVPVILFENVGPRQAIKRSAQLVRQRWGEGLVGTGVIGAVFLLALIPLLVISLIAGVVFAPFGIAIFAIGYASIIVVSSVVSAVFNTALYHYATTGTIGFGFAPDDIQAAFRTRKRR